MPRPTPQANKSYGLDRLAVAVFVLVAEDRSVRGVGGRRGTGALVGPWWVRIRRVNRGQQVDSNGHRPHIPPAAHRPSRHLTSWLGDRRRGVRVSPLAVTTLGGPLPACAELPGPRRPRLGAPARPVPAPGTCEPPAHPRPAAAHGRDELAVGGRLLFQCPGGEQVQAGSHLHPGHHRIGAAAVAAGGLAVATHQHREEPLTLENGPAVDPQKERSAIGLPARTNVRQMLCSSWPPVSNLSAAIPYAASRHTVVPGSVALLSRADVVRCKA
jgi:hypothetical protein